MQEFIKKEPELKFQKGESILKSFRLNEVVDFYKGKNISKKDINKDGKYPCIRYGELYTVYNELISKVISKTDLSKSSLVFSKRKDIIIPSSGETNLDIATASCILKEGIALGGDLNILRPKPSSDFSSIYLAYYLNNKKKKRIAALAQGNSVVHLYKHHLSGLKLMLPDYKEQQKIASFLSTVDKKINLLETKIEHLEQYRKGVVQKIFKQEVRFKDDGNDFPEWKKKKGNKVFSSISNKDHDRELPILAITQEHGAIPRDQIDHKITVTKKSVEGYKKVQKGDFIISLRSFQGGIEYSTYDGICSPAYIILRNKILINDYFYKVYMKTPNYIKELCRKLEGIRDGKMISYKYFSEINLPYPSIQEQTKIANFLSRLDRKIDLHTEQLEKMKVWKKGLLQKMFV